MLMGLTLEVLTPSVKVALSLQAIGWKKCKSLWTLEFGIVELYFQLNDAGTRVMGVRHHSLGNLDMYCYVLQGHRGL